MRQHIGWQALLAGACLLLSGSLSAATFTVNFFNDVPDINPGNGVCDINTSNSPPCSLRAAIMEANALPNEGGVPDVIEFAPNHLGSIYPVTRSGAGEDLGATGDLDITDSLIINGNPANINTVIIDGGGVSGTLQDRVLHIHPPTDDSQKRVQVELNDLVIANGYSTDTRGGGGGLLIGSIANNSEPYQPAFLSNSPSMMGSDVPEPDTTWQPSIVSGQNSKLPTRPQVTLRNVEVRFNYDVVSGAGIMNAGELLIEDSVIRDNRTPYRLGLASGQNGQFNNNSQFIGGGLGGGIANWGGKLTMRRSIISNNIAQTGGGIYSQTILGQTLMRDEQLLIEDSQVTGNTAFMGGGIFNVGGLWDYMSRALYDYGVIVRRSTLDSNRAEYAGAGVYNLGVGATLITDSTLSDNNAADPGLPSVPNKGGGIYHSGKILDVQNSTIAGNTTQRGNRMTGMASADDAIGGDDIFLDVTQANVDPTANIPWRFSLLNTIVGEAGSTDACNGTVGYENFITDAGGNSDASGTCFGASSTTIVNGGGGMMNKVAPRAVLETALGPLANNGGIPGNELPDGTFPPTRALLSGVVVGSAADCSATDQRGFGRDGSVCDAGAFQTDSNTKGISTLVSDLPVARDDHILTARNVSVFVPVTRLLRNDNDPLARGAVTLNHASVQRLDDNIASLMVQIGTEENNTRYINFIALSTQLDFVGRTSFSYTVSVTDPQSGETLVSAPATVTVEVSADNIPPQAFTQGFFATIGGTVNGDLLGGLYSDTSKVFAYDVEGSALTYHLDEDPTRQPKGEVNINADGSFTYTAPTDARLSTDSFAYYVMDQQGARSEPASVVVYLYSATSSAEFAPATVEVQAGKLASVLLRTGADGDYYYGLLSDAAPQQGEVLWLNEKSGELLYRANDDAADTDSFGFQVMDLLAKSSVGQGGKYTGQVDVSINALTDNTAPQANGFELVMGPEETEKGFYLSASDADGDVLLYQIVEQPAKGKLIDIDPLNGMVTYVPNAHAEGSDSFSFLVTDGQQASEMASVSIQLPVAQTNQPPQAADDSAMTPNDLSININVLSNDTDVDGDALQVSLLNQASLQGGALQVTDRGHIQYTPPAGFTGDDEIQYLVDDGHAATDTALLKVRVIAASEGDYAELPEPQPQDNNGEQGSEPPPVLGETSTAPVESGSGGGGSLSWMLLLLASIAGVCRRVYRAA